MTDWRAQAVCTEEQDLLFFPPDDDYATEKVLAAKIICAACPVREQCRAWAKENKVSYGVWGGHTPKERGLKNPKPVTIEEEVKPNLCAGGCGYVMPLYTMAVLEPGQRNYYAKGRCRQCYEHDVYSGALPTVSTERSTFNAYARP